jgi:SAM-dependent methyltransferase
VKNRIVTGLLRSSVGWIINHSSPRGLIWMLSLQNDWVSRIARRSIKVTKREPMASKPILIATLDCESAVDRAVNQLANHYYRGRHPKHYLWTSHNDFIVENIEPGEMVIDIGCGASQYTVRLAEKGVKVLGVDINPERIKSIESVNRHPNLKYAAIDITKELPEEKFDTAICSHLLEHLDDPVAFLKRLKSVASKLIIKVPRVDSGWKKLMKKDLGMFWLDDSSHHKEYTLKLLLDELEQSGWKPVKQETGIDLRALAVCNK